MTLDVWHLINLNIIEKFVCLKKLTQLNVIKLFSITDITLRIVAYNFYKIHKKNYENESFEYDKKCKNFNKITIYIFDKINVENNVYIKKTKFHL